MRMSSGTDEARPRKRVSDDLLGRTPVSVLVSVATVRLCSPSAPAAPLPPHTHPADRPEHWRALGTGRPWTTATRALSPFTPSHRAVNRPPRLLIILVLDAEVKGASRPADSLRSPLTSAPQTRSAGHRGGRDGMVVVAEFAVITFGPQDVADPGGSLDPWWAPPRRSDRRLESARLAS